MHVIAGAVGISALVMASAETFTLLKLAGAVCLIWLGFKTWNEAEIVDPIGVEIAVSEGIPARHYCRSTESEIGCILSRLHPAIYRTTADVARQFVILGIVSVALNTAADVVVTH